GPPERSPLGSIEGNPGVGLHPRDEVVPVRWGGSRCGRGGRLQGGNTVLERWSSSIRSCRAQREIVPAARAVRGPHRQEPGPEPCARGLGPPEGDAPGESDSIPSIGDAPGGSDALFGGRSLPCTPIQM